MYRLALDAVNCDCGVTDKQEAHCYTERESLTGG